MKLTVLSENTALREDLKAEFGLSVYVECGETRLLFDAGEYGAAVDNAREMGIDLSQCTAVAFSHNHKDHTGGIYALKGIIGKNTPIYVRPDFFRLKWWDHHYDDPALPTYMKGMEAVGPALSSDTFFGLGFSGMRMLTDDTFEVSENVYLMGNIPLTRGFEAVHVSQRMDGRSGGFPRDTFRDEQACVIRTGRGLVVLTGCAHNGICNILDTVRARFPGEGIYAVFGGAHLLPPDEKRIEKTAAYFRASGISLSGVCHCTGAAGLAVFAEKVPSYTRTGAGFVFECE